MIDHHHPSPRSFDPPTTKPLRCLRTLARRTGRTFATPRTNAEASQAIRRLQQHPRLTPAARAFERDTREELYGTAVRDDETTGYGSSARWA